MSTLFDKSFDLLMGHEGAYSDHKEDNGGKTKYGVTEKTARTHGYRGHMKDLDVDTAKLIYRQHYWMPVLEMFPLPVAFNIFDAAVNCGPTTAVRMTQQALGIRDDGLFGPMTREALLSMPMDRFLRRFNAIRLEYCTTLDDWKHFGAGWARRIALNLQM